MKILAQKSTVVLLVLTLCAFALSCEQPNGPTDSPVVLIGDSIFALSGEIKNELERLTGQRYRSYCVSGSEMDGGMMGNIPRQYSEAQRTNPRRIKTIIMDGGGNDVQVGGAAVCGMSIGGPSAACKRELQKALNAADQLFTRMRSDGVENIIYMSYFYIQNPASKPAFEWLRGQMATVVQRHNGILVDTTDLMRPALIGPDNIHPTRQGSQMLAGEIYKAMQANNVDTTGGGGGGGIGPGCGR